ncbi:MAG: MoxR family ATPase [Gemmiger sp.]|uniref:MoxR family ATPase n=1 Tax=Gemmiger sp. TaxID=2049027 RepID=UPI002E75FCDB|nr:MoxR family ATPase [Gemmiger sp.]MEE0800162.1 MoxR family ATPase [Gemmiger sp.]
MTDVLQFLREEQISPDLVEALEQYRAAHSLPADLQARIPTPRYLYYGKEVWEQAVTALLCGENLLLAGGKATGKNVLAENLATVFGRPAWNVSFHVNMDASSLIGMDTFEGGRVTFRPGPIYRCAQCGGIGILDEINMAKNEALAVLHAVLDFRRSIDVPGYDRIPLSEETRFVATMNYGYAGTRELNEALTSRFVVIQMPTITEQNLRKLLAAQFPDLEPRYTEQFALLFLDLQEKSASAEISTKALDLRGMLDAIRLMHRGIPAGAALDMGITNKAFDSYEQGLIRDVIKARIPKKLDRTKLFRH